MSNEIQARISLQVKSTPKDYRSNPTAFSANQTYKEGPTPGDINVPIGGVKVDLSQLTTPGVCWIQNTDTALSVEVGVHNGVYFFPVLELGPGECYVVRLSRHLNLTEDVTGTGTIPTSINDLWVKPLTLGPVRVIVDAFGM